MRAGDSAGISRFTAAPTRDVSRRTPAISHFKMEFSTYRNNTLYFKAPDSSHQYTLGPRIALPTNSSR